MGLHLRALFVAAVDFVVTAELASLAVPAQTAAALAKWSHSPGETLTMGGRPSLRWKSIFFHINRMVATDGCSRRLAENYIH